MTFPIEIFTERLRLRPFTLEDKEAVFEYAKEKEANRYLPWPPHETVKDSLNAIEEIYLPHGAYAVMYQRKLVGCIDLFRRESGEYELGYVLNKKYHGRGIMTEAAKAVVKTAFEHSQIDKINSSYITENIASARVLEKAGFSHKVIKPAAVLCKGKMYDMAYVMLYRSEYIVSLRQDN